MLYEEKRQNRKRQSFGNYKERYRPATLRRKRAVKRRKRILLGVGAIGMILGILFWKAEMKKSQHTEVTSNKYLKVEQGNSESEQEKKIQAENKALIENDLLILVNKENKMPEGYEPELHWLNNGRCAVAEVMYDALSEMLTAGSKDGREFVVASGYRSREKQEELLEEDITADMQNLGLSYQEAYDKETRETMPPGYSEHETGLAADIVSLDYQILDEQQEWTEENQWLREHCSEYGFILRYPEGKEDVTGVDYESWHFRYVGKEAAKVIMEQGITLEEYVEQ